MEREALIHPFTPFYDAASEVLILGTFPSPKSREAAFYYSHPQNRFWQVLADIYGEERPPETVTERQDFLRRRHIALWDVISSCTIEGAADSSIRDVVPNDLDTVLRAAPIRAIYLNGKKAERLYQRYIDPKPDLPAICLPSTSPANAAWTRDRLKGEWQRITDPPIFSPNAHMTYFLTSSPCVVGAARLNPANGFVEELKKALPNPCACLFLASDPDSPNRTDGFGNAMRLAFEDAGFRFSSFTILDRRNAGKTADLVARSGLIILAGGHVPTQNRFFQEIGLARLLRGYAGVIVGISAGSMNAAETVYSIPEYPEEVHDPAYVRFLPGLGITQAMILPHYNENKDEILSGLHIYHDIACPDSMGRTFTVLPDGSYLYGHDGIEEVRGEAYRISNGVFRPL